eukprot:4757585-Prymnesium_polylepis.1
MRPAATPAMRPAATPAMRPAATLRPLMMAPRSGTIRMVHPVKRPFTTSAYLASTTRRTMAADWIMRGVPRWVTLLDESLFVLSSAIFVKGSVEFFPGTPFGQYIEGCEYFSISVGIRTAVNQTKMPPRFEYGGLTGVRIPVRTVVGSLLNVALSIFA